MKKSSKAILTFLVFAHICFVTTIQVLASLDLFNQGNQGLFETLVVFTDYGLVTLMSFSVFVSVVLNKKNQFIINALLISGALQIVKVTHRYQMSLITSSEAYIDIAMSTLAFVVIAYIIASLSKDEPATTR